MSDVDITETAGAVLQRYNPSRLQLRLMRLGLRRFRFFRRWMGGVWRKLRGTWRHHLEMTPFELLNIFPLVMIAAKHASSSGATMSATTTSRELELWSLPADELPVARAIRIAAAGDASTEDPPR